MFTGVSARDSPMFQALEEQRLPTHFLAIAKACPFSLLVPEIKYTFGNANPACSATCASSGSEPPACPSGYTEVDFNQSCSDCSTYHCPGCSDWSTCAQRDNVFTGCSSSKAPKKTYATKQCAGELEFKTCRPLFFPKYFRWILCSVSSKECFHNFAMVVHVTLQKTFI